MYVWFGKIFMWKSILSNVLIVQELRGPGMYSWFICFPHAGSQSSWILFNRQMIVWFTDILINKYNTKYYSYTHLVKLKVDNKNAFQWDAYRPLVDRIPACTVQGGVCLCSSGGAVYPSMQWDRHPLWTDRHLWKHNLYKLRFPDGNYTDETNWDQVRVHLKTCLWQQVSGDKMAADSVR